MICPDTMFGEKNLATSIKIKIKVRKKTQKLQHCTIYRHLNNLEYIQWNKNDSQGDSEIFKAPADCPKVKPNHKF